MFGSICSSMATWPSGSALATLDSTVFATGVFAEAASSYQKRRHFVKRVCRVPPSIGQRAVDAPAAESFGFRVGILLFQRYSLGFGLPVSFRIRLDHWRLSPRQIDCRAAATGCKGDGDAPCRRDSNLGQCMPPRHVVSPRQSPWFGPTTLLPCSRFRLKRESCQNPSLVSPPAMVLAA